MARRPRLSKQVKGQLPLFGKQPKKARKKVGKRSVRQIKTEYINTAYAQARLVLRKARFCPAGIRPGEFNEMRSFLSSFVRDCDKGRRRYPRAQAAMGHADTILRAIGHPL